MVKITYVTFNYLPSGAGSSTFLTGVRKCKKSGSNLVFLTGFYEPAEGSQVGFVYRGLLTSNLDGIFNTLSFPSSYSTSPYGPDRYHDTIYKVSVVGNYLLEISGNAFGFLYKGRLDGSGSWFTIVPPFAGAVNTVCHSIMNGMIVGNYATIGSLDSFPTPAGIKAFIYNSETNTYQDIIKSNTISITAYGIWHNEGHGGYTIAGGYTSTNNILYGYLVDWNEHTGKLTHWRRYRNRNSRATHFDGITSDNHGGYNLTGIYQIGDSSTAFFINSRKN